MNCFPSTLSAAITTPSLARIDEPDFQGVIDPTVYVQSCVSPATSAVLKLLDGTGFKLGGSRLFHCRDPLTIPVTQTTDWDFCGEYTPDNVKFLIDNNFDVTAGANSPYLDRSARSVFERHITTTGEKVQVVLREDCEAFMAMLYAIKVSFYSKYLWKSGPSNPDRNEIQTMINQLIGVQRSYQQLVSAENA